MAAYTVIYVDLDMPRKGADYSDWCPHIDGGGSAIFDTLEEAMADVDDARESLYCDALIEGDNVPSEYARFECGPYHH